MSTKSITWRQERANLIKQARELVDRADSDKREMNQEEKNSYSAWMKTQEELREKIDNEEKLESLEKEMRSGVGSETRPDPRGDGTDRSKKEAEKSVYETQEYHEAYGRYLRSGDSNEIRSFSVGNLTQAGLLVAPVELVKTFLKKVDDAVFIRQKATKFPLSQAMKLQVPELADDPDEPETVTELTVGSEDTTMDVGARYLEPHPVSKSFKLSRDLIRMSLINVEDFVMTRLAYKFGIHEEKKFLLGTGFQEPLGLFTASSLGIPTTRDVSTGNNTTGPTIEGLKSAKYSLKEQHMVASEWIFHRNVVEYISKLKDGDGRYYWQDSVQENEPDRLLGRPVRMSEFAPSTFTTGLYMGIIGNFSYYWIADAYDMEIQPLFELSARTNQVEYISRASYDGRPVLNEAFARVKNA